MSKITPRGASTASAGGRAVPGTDLEEEPDAVARDRDLEVAVLLVSARVRAERDPRVVGRVHGAARVLGDVREHLAPERAAHRRRQALAEHLELGADAAPELGHAGPEALHVEDLEISRDEG